MLRSECPCCVSGRGGGLPRTANNPLLSRPQPRFVLNGLGFCGFPLFSQTPPHLLPPGLSMWAPDTDSAGPGAHRCTGLPSAPSAGQRAPGAPAVAPPEGCASLGAPVPETRSSAQRLQKPRLPCTCFGESVTPGGLPSSTGTLGPEGPGVRSHICSGPRVQWLKVHVAGASGQQGRGPGRHWASTNHGPCSPK